MPHQGILGLSLGQNRPYTCAPLDIPFCWPGDTGWGGRESLAYLIVASPWCVSPKPRQSSDVPDSDQSYSPMVFINFTLIKMVFAAMWQWHTCQADDKVQGQPGLQSEFQDSQSYTEKPCLKKQTKNKPTRVTERQRETKRQMQTEMQQTPMHSDLVLC